MKHANEFLHTNCFDQTGNIVTEAFVKNLELCASYVKSCKKLLVQLTLLTVKLFR